MPDPTYASTVSEEIAITMADGVRLGATITFPSVDGPTRAARPVSRRWSRSRPKVATCMSSAPDRDTFATRGIIGVTVDTRGTGGSEGNLNENYFSPAGSQRLGDGNRIHRHAGLRQRQGRHGRRLLRRHLSCSLRVMEALCVLLYQNMKTTKLRENWRFAGAPKLGELMVPLLSRECPATKQIG